MQLKTLVSVLLIPVLLSSCSILGQRQVEVVTKPVKIDIAQPGMPRPIDLKEPKWYVVSDAKIIEACLKDPETKESNCKLGREDKYPEGKGVAMAKSKLGEAMDPIGKSGRHDIHHTDG